jgi:ERO1-like protein alpha
MLQSCPLPFDEARLWKGQHGQALKAQLQVAFQNITRIMDCVGCEKCKLWGKLQTLGGCCRRGGMGALRAQSIEPGVGWPA